MSQPERYIFWGCPRRFDAHGGVQRALDEFGCGLEDHLPVGVSDLGNNLLSFDQDRGILK